MPSSDYSDFNIAMAADKINVWGDPRVQLRSAHLRGRTYGFLYAPVPNPKATVILIHGFPDISSGWRYQIPMFLSMGYTVIAPDCMGYGRTDAPIPLRDYGYKRIADDLAELASQLGIGSFILGGHDWGGAIVYRVAQYYPKLVSHVFSICTPFFTPSVDYEPLHLLVEKRLPNFRYQEHFASGEIEERCVSQDEIKGFLNGLFGAKTKEGKAAFDAEGRVNLDLLGKLQKTPLLSEEELEFYAREYARHGLRGPLNWYRNREVNWQDEWIGWFENGTKRGQGPRIEQETLFVLATWDQALKPFMAAKMGERIPRLTRKEVKGGHWILWQKSRECNEVLKEWFEEKVEGKAKSKL
jgi:pimeloyl-ACP methyl ester carboxylesterase